MKCGLETCIFSSFTNIEALTRNVDIVRIYCFLKKTYFFLQNKHKIKKRIIRKIVDLIIELQFLFGEKLFTRGTEIVENFLFNIWKTVERESAVNIIESKVKRKTLVDFDKI